MNRALFSMAVGALSVVVSTAFGAELSAAQIVDKNVAARGGLLAWRGVTSITMAGEMDAGGRQDVKLPFVMNLKRPHKNRLEIRFQEQTLVQTYDGRQGWKFRPYLGRTEAEPLTQAETQSASAADELDGPLIDYARKGVKVEYQGMDAVEGKKAYKLRLTRIGAPPRNVWVDAQSFLELKIDGEPRKLDGRPHNVTVFYRDYKKVGTLTLPHTLETVVAGVKQTHKISIKTVTLNSPLDDALFGKPQPNALKAAAS